MLRGYDHYDKQISKNLWHNFEDISEEGPWNLCSSGFIKLWLCSCYCTVHNIGYQDRKKIKAFQTSEMTFEQYKGVQAWIDCALMKSKQQWICNHIQEKRNEDWSRLEWWSLEIPKPGKINDQISNYLLVKLANELIVTWYNCRKYTALQLHQDCLHTGQREDILKHICKFVDIALLIHSSLSLLFSQEIIFVFKTPITFYP